ncbi:MAG: hypothetical protein PVH88_20915 [Ignavibacteria bacterium]|jgi:hypothetical protein
MMQLKIARYLGMFVFVSFVAFAQSSNEIKVGKIHHGELDYRGFSLSKNAEILIEGACASYDNWDEEMDFYAWILDSETREVVWHVLDEYYDERGEGLFDVDDRLNLPAGNYEVYYTANSYDGIYNHDLGDILGNLFKSRKEKYRSRDRLKLYINVSGPSGVFKSNDGETYIDNKAKGAVVSIIRATDYESYEKGFSLKAPTELRIYALGEGRKREIYDYGWIYDVRNHKRVWTMNYRNTDHAGGGKKNVYADEVIELPKGSYIVNYVTDDSHSFEEWNVTPPNDPQYYGISIFIEDKNQSGNVIAFKDADVIKPIVDLSRMGDDEYESQGFKLDKDMDLRILCLGERSSRNNMADYGWIIDAVTRETVWEMKAKLTDHAGGGEKNRMIDEVVRFDKGEYIAYYVTDDSHSYKDWNVSPPYEKNKWGLTIWVAEESDRDDVTLFNEDEFSSDKVIAAIVRVRDDRYISKKFELDEDTRVRIIAIGEGDRGEMYDYGWIKDLDRNRIVWEMTYRKTDHAGGAKKNRIIKDTIILPKGEYKLYYETDGSHSYRDWNSSPPREAERYGITLLYENER